MNTEYDFDGQDNGQTVYIRAVETQDLPLDLQEKLDGLKTIYAVHNEEGQRLALVRERDLAFMLARQNDYAPVTVH